MPGSEEDTFIVESDNTEFTGFLVTSPTGNLSMPSIGAPSTVCFGGVGHNRAGTRARNVSFRYTVRSVNPPWRPLLTEAAIQGRPASADVAVFSAFLTTTEMTRWYHLATVFIRNSTGHWSSGF